ncbi:hypothetical protein [Streptomyces sp. NPDC096132]|uniref:hypothetical protein n=1 Tax=Streptomyces sp. NPDC096132 TaxID=3366075 RepID=UPI003801BFB5
MAAPEPLAACRPAEDDGAAAAEPLAVRRPAEDDGAAAPEPLAVRRPAEDGRATVAEAEPVAARSGVVTVSSATNETAASDIGGAEASASASGPVSESSSDPAFDLGTPAAAAAIADGPFDRRGSGACTVASFHESYAERVRQHWAADRTGVRYTLDLHRNPHPTPTVFVIAAAHPARRRLLQGRKTGDGSWSYRIWHL